MTDEKQEVGSNSGAGDVKADPASKTVNKAAKMSMDQAYAEIENHKRVVEEKDSVIAALTR